MIAIAISFTIGLAIGAAFGAAIVGHVYSRSHTQFCACMHPDDRCGADYCRRRTTVRNTEHAA